MFKDTDILFLFIFRNCFKSIIILYKREQFLNYYILENFELKDEKFYVKMEDNFDNKILLSIFVLIFINRLKLIN